MDWRAGAPPADTGQAAPALGAAVEKIDHISLRHENLALELTRSQGQWMLDAPVKARAADAGRVNRLLATAENLPRLESISESERQARGVTLADYGLAAPRARIVFGAGGRRTATLDIGNLAPLKDALYVRFDLQSAIVATATNLLDVIPRALEDLRDRRLVTGNPGAVGRMEIKPAQGPLIKLAREGNEWIIQRPVIARAERQKVVECLNQIHALRIERFVSETMADPVAYGLSDDEASLQVSLWPENTAAGTKINFGKPVAGESLLYAALADAASVYAVPRAAVEALPAQLTALRDTRLYFMAPEKTAFIAIESGNRLLRLQRTNQTWQITAPIQAKADRQSVADLLHRLNTLRIENFAERSGRPPRPPWINRKLSSGWPIARCPPGYLHNRLKTPQPAAERPVAGRVLRIGAFAGRSRPGIYAQFDDDRQIIELSAAAVSAFPRMPPIIATAPCLRSIRKTYGW